MWISDFAIRRPIITITVMLAIVAFGLAALMNLQVDEFPDLDQPVVMVQIPYPGASPDVVEREVVEPIEEAIFGLSGNRPHADHLEQRRRTRPVHDHVRLHQAGRRGIAGRPRRNLDDSLQASDRDRGADHHAFRLGRPADPVADALVTNARRAHIDDACRSADRRRTPRRAGCGAGDGDRRQLSGVDDSAAAGSDAVGGRRDRRRGARGGEPESCCAGGAAQRRAERAGDSVAGAAGGRRSIPFARRLAAQRHTHAIGRRCWR